MWKKYCKISFLVLLTVLVVPCFFSCSDDSEDVVVNMNPPQYESVSGKYEITDSSSPYASVELGASGDYIVIKRSNSNTASSLKKENLFSRKSPASRAVTYGNVVYGIYTPIDNESFNLEGFGVIQLKSDGGQGITDITIKPDSGNEMNFTVKKAETMGDDELTNALCRTWKVLKIHEKGYDSYDGEYDDTILSSTLYKYDYDAIVSRIVAEIYSTAGMNMGEVPTYDRREIMDIDSVQFFDPGIQSDGTEPDRLTNMDYQEYQSVILYSRENSLPWFLSVSIDSVQALEIDLYIRINKNGTIYTHYLGTMHTDPNQNFSWAGDIPEGEDGSESDVDYNSLVANQQSWEIPTVLAEHLPDDTEDLPADLEQLMSEGVSTVNVDLLADAGEYYALMGYKLPIYSDYVSGPTNVSKGDTTADLSHLLVCGNTENDFLEIVFDVQHSSSGNNPDYRFKFLIEVVDLLSGTDEEETT